MKKRCEVCGRGAKKRQDESSWHCICICGEYGVTHRPDGSWRCGYCGTGNSAGPKTCPECGSGFLATERHLKYHEGSGGGDLCDNCFQKLMNWGIQRFAEVFGRKVRFQSAKGKFRN